MPLRASGSTRARYGYGYMAQDRSSSSGARRVTWQRYQSSSAKDTQISRQLGHQLNVKILSISICNKLRRMLPLQRACRDLITVFFTSRETYIQAFLIHSKSLTDAKGVYGLLEEFFLSIFAF